MKKLKAFIYVYYKSLTNFPYYRDVLKTNFSFSIKYFVFLIFFVSLISSVKMAFNLVPEITNNFGTAFSNLKSFFPDDLTLTIKGGEWEINKPEPLIIPLQFAEKTPESSETPKNLIVLYKNGTIDDLKNMDTLVLVNKVNVLYREGEGWRGYPIKNLPDSTVGKSEFESTMKSVESMLRMLPTLFVIGAFIFTLIGNLVVRSFYFAWLGLLVWLIAKATGNDSGYKNALKIAMHSATLPITIGLLFELVGLVIPIPLWFSMINILIATLVLLNMKKVEKNEEAQK